MNVKLGFFSSDARPLYKEDIYRALALPKKSVIHFRYDQKDVDEDVKKNINLFINNDGVIFYLTGNSSAKKVEDRIITTYSIRKVIIKDIERSENTELLHFYLELGDYYDCNLKERDKNKFVSKIQISEGTKHKWIDRVKSIKDSNDNILFFNFEILKSNKKVLEPKYSKLNHSSVYYLEDESEYIMKCSFYDKQEGKSYLEINDSDIIKINYKDKSGIGAVLDDRQYKISTSTITRRSVTEEVRLSPTSTSKRKRHFKYEVVSLFEIRKRIWKVIIFGFYTGLAFTSVLLSQLLSNLIKDSKPLEQIVFIGLIPVILVGGSAALLFSQFNKK